MVYSCCRKVQEQKRNDRQPVTNQRLSGQLNPLVCNSGRGRLPPVLVSAKSPHHGTAEGNGTEYWLEPYTP